VSMSTDDGDQEERREEMEDVFDSLVHSTGILAAENERVDRLTGLRGRDEPSHGTDHDAEDAYRRSAMESYRFHDVIIDAARQAELEYATYAACEAIVSLEERNAEYERRYGPVGSSVPELVARVRAVARGEPGNSIDHQQSN